VPSAAPRAGAAHPHEREPELLARVPARQVAQHVVVVIVDDAQDDVRRADPLRALRLAELPQPLYLPRGAAHLDAAGMARHYMKTLTSQPPHHYLRARAWQLQRNIGEH